MKSITRHILMWSYERGTLQYDIICVLILLFIFLVPRSCFVPKKTSLQLKQNAAVSQNNVKPGIDNNEHK